MIIGEYATFTTWPSDIDYYSTKREVALYAMDYLVKKTKEAGIGTFYWMGLSDGKDRATPQWTMPKTKAAIMKAYSPD